MSALGRRRSEAVIHCRTSAPFLAAWSSKFVNKGETVSFDWGRTKATTSAMLMSRMSSPAPKRETRSPAAVATARNGIPPTTRCPLGAVNERSEGLG